MAHSPGIFHWPRVQGFVVRASRLPMVVATLATVFLASPAFAAWGGNAQPVANQHLPAKAKKKSKVPLPLETLNCPANFITAMVPDGHGGVYVASEDSGIYHGAVTVGHAGGGPRAMSAGKPAFKITTVWKHYGQTGPHGLASDFITALCMDGRGRLWAGTNRRGVCVFNGKKWKHYGIFSGPLGCHVYAIAFDAPANQIWIATENGLSIYQCGSGGAGVLTRKRVPRYAPHTWHYITTAEEPPANPDAVAFGSSGRIFVGSQAGGLAIGTPQRTAHANLKSILSYKPDRAIQYTWRVIQGPWHLPSRPFGSGLPSNLVNALQVGAVRKVLVATDWGLAVSENGGASFRYQRGEDYAAKVLGLWHPPAYFQMPSKRFLAKLLPGDHITALAQDAMGNFWIGTWRNGFEVLNPRTRQSYRFAGNPANPKNGGYVSQFCAIAFGSVAGAESHRSRNFATVSRGKQAVRQIMLVGYYGSGVWAFGRPISGRRARHNVVRAVPLGVARSPQFPVAAAAPAAAKLTALLPGLATASHFATLIHFPYAAFLRDDWATEGDWTGRYGREYAVLCSAHWDLDFHVCCRDYTSGVSGMIGPHHGAGDCLREWEQWADTDNPRSLYIPQLGYRRETTWDDHGETYPVAYQGPDVWVRVHLKKAGLWRVGMYFFNKDGHAGPCRQRDYVAQVYSIGSIFGKAAANQPLSARTFPPNHRALAWARWAMRTRPLAQGRVVNFWGGVYLRFLLAGPGQYMIRLDRNASLDTILQAVFIDPEIAKPDLFTSQPMADMGRVQYRPPAISADPTGDLATAISVWRAAQHAFGQRGAATRRLARLLCYRYALAHHAPAKLLANWRWHLDIWKPQDRQVFDNTMNQAFRARLKGWKGLRAFMEKDGDLQANSGEMGNE